MDHTMFRFLSIFAAFGLGFYVGADGNIRYWRDEQSVNHVPKRSLEDIINEKY